MTAGVFHLCAACGQPADCIRWCDCHLCRACAEGIVASCPVCGAGFPSTYMREFAQKRRPGDYTGFWFVAGLMAATLALFALAWLAS